MSHCIQVFSGQPAPGGNISLHILITWRTKPFFLGGIYVPSGNKPGPAVNDENDSPHVHDHTGITSCNDRHCHVHPGVTGPPVPYNNTHYHEIIGQTTYQDGHYHTYRAPTSTAVALPGGYHTHYASFSTSLNDEHRHEITGYVAPLKPELK